MRSRNFVLLFSLLALSTGPAVASAHPRRGPTSPHNFRRPAKTRVLSQRSIDDDRATQIQSALIQAGYLTGPPSGHWDAESEAAMGKLQADNGWQTKLVPDSRALIKLGLGPTTATAAAPSSSAPSLTAQR
jgi:peptidoglycan hydrolase-like protein with peptidoglycan-binding domain